MGGEDFACGRGQGDGTRAIPLCEGAPGVEAFGVNSVAVGLGRGTEMRLLVALQDHFWRDARGHVYPSPPHAFDYRFWQEYLEIFEEVLVLARVRRGPRWIAGSARADGPGVLFHDLPEYVGPWEYLRWLPILRRRVREAVATADAFIFKLTGAIGTLAWRAVRDCGKPFAIHLVTDPWDLLSPGTTPTILRPIVRRIWVREVRQMCREASAVAYVTRETLQRRYPAGEDAYVTWFSNVELGGGLIGLEEMQVRIARLRRRSSLARSDGQVTRVGTVGALGQHKAPDVLLQAVAACIRGGFNLHLELVGDGIFRPELESLAQKLGIADRVRFRGALPPGRAIFDFLDTLDLFVLASRSEGLPRAMIEAMARGCPCIGSNVGGIPELLPEEDLVPPGDVDALARKISEVLSDPRRMEQMARRNWEAAKEYLPEGLLQRQQLFYRKVRELADRSVSSSGRSSGENFGR